MDNGENDASIPGVDASQLERHVKNLWNCLKPLPSFKQPEEKPQIQTATPVVLLEARAKLDHHLDDNVYPAARVISDTTMTDQFRSSEGPNPATQRYGLGSKVGQSGKLAEFATRVTNSAIGRRSSMSRPPC